MTTGITVSTHHRRRENGSAVVEFVFLSVVMLIPLVYLVLMLARLEAGTFATSLASREAARAFVTAPTQGSADARATAAADLVFEDFDITEGAVVVDCDGSPCIRPDGVVTVTARVVVPLPLIPAFAREVIPLEVPVTTEYALRVDRFQATPP